MKQFKLLMIAILVAASFAAVAQGIGFSISEKNTGVVGQFSAAQFAFVRAKSETNKFDGNWFGDFEVIEGAIDAALDATFLLSETVAAAVGDQDDPSAFLIAVARNIASDQNSSSAETRFTSFNDAESYIDLSRTSLNTALARLKESIEQVDEAGFLASVADINAELDRLSLLCASFLKEFALLSS